jgi:hypothetical protein
MHFTECDKQDDAIRAMKEEKDLNDLIDLMVNSVSYLGDVLLGASFEDPIQHPHMKSWEERNYDKVLEAGRQTEGISHLSRLPPECEFSSNQPPVAYSWNNMLLKTRPLNIRTLDEHGGTEDELWQKFNYSIEKLATEVSCSLDCKPEKNTVEGFINSESGGIFFDMADWGVN